jgi:hypothetical protein
MNIKRIRQWPVPPVGKEYDYMRQLYQALSDESSLRLGDFNEVVGRLYFQSVVPASGRYQLGSTVINSEPAIGEPIGWRCTVAGEPGTWEAIPNNHSGVYEPVLGNPLATGYILSSTDAGVRSWVAASTPSAHALVSATHTASGLTTGHFLKATGATSYGFGAHGLTYSDVGADVSGAASTAVGTHESTYSHTNYNTAYAWGNHAGLYSLLAHNHSGVYDPAGTAASAVSAHAALITGVHGLVFTAGKTLTLTESLTLNALPIGGLAVATGANVLGSLAVGTVGQYLAGAGAGTVPSWATLNQAVVAGLTTGDSPAFAGLTLTADLTVPNGGTGASTLADGGLMIGNAAGAVEVVAAGTALQILVGGGALTAPVWGTDLPAAVTIGSAYIYRAAGTDVPVTDGGTGASTLALNGVLYGNTTAAVGVTAIGAQYQVLTVGANPFVPAWSGYLISGTTGGKTTLAVTNLKTLTITSTDDYNLTVAATSSISGTNTGDNAANSLYDIGSDTQAYSARLTEIAALAVTDSNIIVGNGASWVAETGATARTSLGLAIGADVQAYNATLASVAAGTYSGDDSIVTVGTVTAGGWHGTEIAADHGGTGQTVYAVGDLLYASTTTALSKLADVAVGSYLRSGGVGVVPLWSTLTLPNAGTAYRLPVYSATNVMTELAEPGATGEYLKGNTGAIPSWATLNQAAIAGLTTGDSPAFVTVKLSGLTDGYIPYHVSDAAGLADSAIFNSLGKTGFGMVTPFATITIPGGESYVGMFGIEANANAAGRRWWIHTDYGAFGDFAISTEATKQQSANPNLNRFYISATGNVGIGMTPTYKLDITGDLRCSTGFGCNSKTPQTAYASGGDITPGAGAYGADSAANFAAMVTLVKNMRTALVACGIMS